MANLVPVLLLAGPLALLAAGLLPPALADRNRALAFRLATGAAGIALAAALGAAAAIAMAGPSSHVLAAFWPGGPGLALQADALTAVMLVLVSFVGLVVVAYSRNYLDGHPRHGRFGAGLALTLAAVQTLVVSGNLALFVAAWVGMSLALHRLLMINPERPAARRAAQWKFAVSRTGDLCLILAAVLAASSFGTLDMAGIGAAARTMAAGGTAVGWGVHAIAGLLVVAAVLKSAQFPFHGWLPDTVDVPTPVSALLHAGLINAGGFLIVRMSDVMVLSALSLEALAIIGAITALVGAAVMLTQSSVKVSLAWSTISQMGFMLLQCGLGAFSTAVLHIVAHALYKAHAFLSAGSVVDRARVAALTGPGAVSPGPAARRAGIAAAVLVGAGAIAALAGGAAPGAVVLVSVTLLGLVPLLAAALGEAPTPARALLGVAFAAAVAGAAFMFQAAAALLLRGAVASPAAGSGPVVLAGLTVMGFAAVVAVQLALPAIGRTRFGRALYVHLSNGFYVEVLTARLAGRFRAAAAGRSVLPGDL